MSVRSFARKSPLARYVYARSYALRAFSKPRSFAQAGEDLLVEELIGPVYFFIDIGAHDGISGSNTFYFARKGARGICFEPVKWTFKKLQSLYLFNRRVICRNVGISDQSREVEIVAADFLSYLPETQDIEHLALHRPLETKREPIRLETFADAVSRLNIPYTVDLLSIDVEGHELNVLRSIPFKAYMFRAIVVETHLQNENGGYKWSHRDIEAIESLLSQSGYEPKHKTCANTVYVHR